MKYTSESVKQYQNQIISVIYVSYCKGISRDHTRTGTLSKINDDTIEMNFFGFLYNSTIEYKHIKNIVLVE